MKVRIQGVEHKLECKPRRLADLNTIGYYTSVDAIIGIDNIPPLPVQKEVLWHEVIEALSHVMELDLEHNKITSLSTGINQVVEDNPHLFTNKFKGVK